MERITEQFSLEEGAQKEEIQITIIQDLIKIKTTFTLIKSIKKK